MLASGGAESKVNARGHVKLFCPDCKHFDGLDWCDHAKVHIPAGYFCLVSPEILALLQKRE